MDPLTLSNTVVAIVLPYVSNFVAKVEPELAVHIVRANITYSRHDVGVVVLSQIKFRTGESFGLTGEEVNTAEFTQPFERRKQDQPVSKEGAVVRARALIEKLGYKLDLLYADRPAEIWSEGFENREVWRLAWPHPTHQASSVALEISKASGRLVRLDIWNENKLTADSPLRDLLVKPTDLLSNFPGARDLPAAEGREEMLRAMAKVNSLRTNASLSIKRPFSTNTLQSWRAFKYREDKFVCLDFDDGAKFAVTNDKVTGYHGGDALFGSEKDVPLAGMVRSPRISDEAAVRFGRQFIQRLGFNVSSLINGVPELRRPNPLVGGQISRIQVGWMKILDGYLASDVTVEVDTYDSLIKSFGVRE